MNPLKSLMRWRIAGFEREHDYDMGYAREILDASPRALISLSRITGFTQYRQDVPLEAWYATKLVGTLGEDCGPCTQLVAGMAEREGMDPGQIRAVLQRDRVAMTPETALGFRFAQAALAHDAQADELRGEVLQRWGGKALVSLAFALTSARIFPTLKYALGHGQSCRRVCVGGVDMPVRTATA
jgi:hypothetical protein